MTPLEYAPLWLWCACASVFGAMMASFAGVVAYRLPHQLGIAEHPDPSLGVALPPSFCDACRTPLDPVSLIPIFGWLIRRGRAACCTAPVPWTHPLIEAMSALCCATLVLWLGPTQETALIIVLLWFCLTLGWTDAIHTVLPDTLTIPAFWFGLLLSPIEPDPYARALGAFAAFAAILLAFAVAGRLRRIDAFSGGDAVLAAAGGAWVGLNWVPWFIGSASLIFIVQALPGRLRGVTMKPFGPALCVALAGTAIAAFDHF